MKLTELREVHAVSGLMQFRTATSNPGRGDRAPHGWWPGCILRPSSVALDDNETKARDVEADGDHVRGQSDIHGFCTVLAGTDGQRSAQMSAHLERRF
jgi:hypothetical protein